MAKTAKKAELKFTNITIALYTRELNQFGILSGSFKQLCKESGESKETADVMS